MGKTLSRSYGSVFKGGGSSSSSSSRASSGGGGSSKPTTPTAEPKYSYMEPGKATVYSDKPLSSSQLAEAQAGSGRALQIAGTNKFVDVKTGRELSYSQADYYGKITGYELAPGGEVVKKASLQQPSQIKTTNEGTRLAQYEGTNKYVDLRTGRELSYSQAKYYQSYSLITPSKLEREEKAQASLATTADYAGIETLRKRSKAETEVRVQMTPERVELLSDYQKLKGLEYQKEERRKSVEAKYLKVFPGLKGEGFWKGAGRAAVQTPYYLTFGLGEELASLGSRYAYSAKLKYSSDPLISGRYEKEATRQLVKEGPSAAIDPFVSRVYDDGKIKRKFTGENIVNIGLIATGAYFGGKAIQKQRLSRAATATEFESIATPIKGKRLSARNVPGEIILEKEGITGKATIMERYPQRLEAINKPIDYTVKTIGKGEGYVEYAYTPRISKGETVTFGKLQKGGKSYDIITEIKPTKKEGVFQTERIIYQEGKTRPVAKLKGRTKADPLVFTERTAFAKLGEAEITRKGALDKAVATFEDFGIVGKKVSGTQSIYTGRSRTARVTSPRVYAVFEEQQLTKPKTYFYEDVVKAFRGEPRSARIEVPRIIEGKEKLKADIIGYREGGLSLKDIGGIKEITPEPGLIGLKREPRILIVSEETPSVISSYQVVGKKGIPKTKDMISKKERAIKDFDYTGRYETQEDFLIGSSRIESYQELKKIVPLEKPTGIPDYPIRKETFTGSLPSMEVVRFIEKNPYLRNRPVDVKQTFGEEIFIPKQENIIGGRQRVGYKQKGVYETTIEPMKITPSKPLRLNVFEQSKVSVRPYVLPATFLGGVSRSAMRTQPVMRSDVFTSQIPRINVVSKQSRLLRSEPITRIEPVSRIDTKVFTTQDQRIFTKQKTLYTPPITTTKTIIPPPPPITTPPPIIPFIAPLPLPFGFGGVGGKKKGKGKKRTTRYTPTLLGTTTRIKGFNFGGKFSGLEIRPIRI